MLHPPAVMGLVALCLFSAGIVVAALVILGRERDKRELFFLDAFRRKRSRSPRSRSVRPPPPSHTRSYNGTSGHALPRAPHPSRPSIH